MLPVKNGYNEISGALRKQLTDERVKVGKIAKYKFYIARKNPDGLHKPGEEYLFPATYTLTPVTYQILDKEDQVFKTIGLFDGVHHQPGTNYEESKFRRITLRERDEGILTLDLSVPEHVENFEYLEMHPKNENGFFRDKHIPALFCRIDELAEAKTRLRTKELRGETILVATKMSEAEVRNFAAAMNWNDLDDYEILKDKMIEIADKDPIFFRKFVDDPKLEYKAIIKRAVDANVISWIPLENKFVWTTNGSTIAMLERTEDGKYLDQFSDWCMSTKAGPETYKKIRSLLLSKV